MTAPPSRTLEGVTLRVMFGVVGRPSPSSIVTERETGVPSVAPWGALKAMSKVSDPSKSSSELILMAKLAVAEVSPCGIVSVTAVGSS